VSIAQIFLGLFVGNYLESYKKVDEKRPNRPAKCGHGYARERFDCIWPNQFIAQDVFK